MSKCTGVPIIMDNKMNCSLLFYLNESHLSNFLCPVIINCQNKQEVHNKTIIISLLKKHY